jgi:hypothetical protein
MVGGLDRHHGPAAEATLVMGWSLGVLSSMRENMKVAGGGGAFVVACSFLVWTSFAVGVVVGCRRPRQRQLSLFLF